MKENNIIPQVGGYLRTIAEVLMAISLCALAFSLFVWMFAIFSMSDTSGLQAFSYVLCSISGIVSSVILLGFSYIVKAAILYLDKNGEFDNDENIEQTAQQYASPLISQLDNSIKLRNRKNATRGVEIKSGG